MLPDGPYVLFQAFPPIVELFHEEPGVAVFPPPPIKKHCPGFICLPEGMVIVQPVAAPVPEVEEHINTQQLKSTQVLP